MMHGSRIALALALWLLPPAFVSAAPPAGEFIAVGSMTTARRLHSSTLLSDGRVLIAGGTGSGFAANTPGRSAEIYDPRTRAFTATGNMVRARATHSATLLTDGRVLIAGGWSERSAEIFDPAAGTFSPTGDMSVLHRWHVAARLPDGKVLIAGGEEAELYDPATGRFAPAAAYTPGNTFVYNGASLADGRVLLVGSHAQLYDPAGRSFTATGSRWEPGYDYGDEMQSMTLLADGRVLIAGGLNEEVSPLWLVRKAQIFDPSSRRFSAAGSMSAPRAFHGAALLPDGRVLVAGGESATCAAVSCRSVLASTEVYDPSTNRFEPGPAMTKPRSAVLTRLASGDILVTGGADASAELFRPLASAISYQGAWWASPPGSEAGWGLSIAHQGDILFAVWSTYDADGRPMWLVVPRAEREAPATYSGAMYRTTGPSFDSAQFDPSAVTATAVGRATFSFSDEDHGSFAYEMQGVRRSKPITRFVFHVMPR